MSGARERAEGLLTGDSWVQVEPLQDQVSPPVEVLFPTPPKRRSWEVAGS